jgi:hypothetical protein
VKNLIDFAVSLGETASDQVAAGLIKHKMERENIDRGYQCKLSTAGKSLNVTVGTCDNKSKRKSIKQISFSTIMELSSVLTLTQNQSKKLCSTLRKNLDCPNSMEPNISTKMEKLQDSLEEFYTTETVEFFENSQIILRDMVYVNNTSQFIQHIIEERGLDIHNTIVRISLDAGQNFLKAIVNVFDPSEPNQDIYSDSGVRKCFILAIVEDVSEDNGNLQNLLIRLKLHEVSFYIAFDLKCGNSVFGLSNHAGKYSCLYCEGECSMEPGTSRTLGSLDYWYEKFVSEGKVRSRMKNYKNVINPRLLYLTEDPEILLEHCVPPPELHILMGVVTKLGVLLLQLWPQFESWLKKHNIMFRGYQGVGFDGNNSSKLLSLVDILERDLMSDRLKLLPLVQCLRSFACLKDSVFGLYLGENAGDKIDQFKKSFLDLQSYMKDIFDVEITVSWKIHIAVCHILPFVEKNRSSLGRFAEQCGEAVHSKFKPTWARFKRTMGHKDYSKKLKSATIQFGIHNM